MDTVCVTDVFAIAFHFYLPLYLPTTSFKLVTYCLSSSAFIFLKLIFFSKQLGSDISPQSCLYFQRFQGSKLVNACLVV